MSLVPSIANVMTDGIASWKMRDATDSDVAYYALPIPRKSNLKITTFETKDKTLQTISVSYLLEASMEFMAMRTTIDFIKILPLFSTKLIEHKIELIDGGRIISSAPTGATPMSPTGFGTVKWGVVSDKDMDDAMVVTIAIRRKLTKTEHDLIMTASLTPGDGSSTPGDIFHVLTVLTEADVVPAGLAKLELGTAAAGTYLDDIDNFRKGVFKAELMPAEDGRGMYRGGAIQIDVDVESLETTEAELLKWGDIQFRKNECRVTFVNGLICTLPNTSNDGLGVKTELNVIKDMDDLSFLKVIAGGRILPSQWNARWGT